MENRRRSDVVLPSAILCLQEVWYYIVRNYIVYLFENKQTAKQRNRKKKQKQKINKKKTHTKKKQRKQIKIDVKTMSFGSLFFFIEDSF